MNLIFLTLLSIRIGERNFEWYDIVDLREWMENKQ